MIKTGERPLHALRERGVEYVEVRCMDLDPFVPVGIAAPTMRFIDVFLLHCLLSPSPPDTPQEIASLGRNQHRAAAFGRQPGLKLERDGAEVLLTEWAEELMAQCTPLAAALDAVQGGSENAGGLVAARAALAAPDTLPSARALATIEQDFGKSYTAFIRAHAEQTRNHLLALPWAPARQAAYEAMSRESLAQTAALEAASTGDFESFRHAYLAPERLGA